jgi:hypothetical protein
VIADETRRLSVEVPDALPVLDVAGWRLLLAALVETAEAEFGPDWRERLA